MQKRATFRMQEGNAFCRQVLQDPIHQLGPLRPSQALVVQIFENVQACSSEAAALASPVDCLIQLMP